MASDDLPDDIAATIGARTSPWFHKIEAWQADPEEWGKWKLVRKEPKRFKSRVKDTQRRLVKRYKGTRWQFTVTTPDGYAYLAAKYKKETDAG